MHRQIVGLRLNHNDIVLEQFIVKRYLQINIYKLAMFYF